MGNGEGLCESREWAVSAHHNIDDLQTGQHDCPTLIWSVSSQCCAMPLNADEGPIVLASAVPKIWV